MMAGEERARDRMMAGESVLATKKVVNSESAMLVGGQGRLMAALRGSEEPIALLMSPWAWPFE